ncbi:DUF6204 family protein [Streptomyces sp. VRA16 Mangrove soil]|uniref:DUF6204 family protein n=1 Tax=Streptomyces sp. VRA16 Mangrove soil TaxID=2817434 RepID=UPI001A9DAB86|nr:DUF6204 family protein [Streptomyces sp. VRA16 Mangrove soil]MBO1331114.1 hypothetical protein [Streptomyces sp. VRA16 Mangrove soil]
MAESHTYRVIVRGTFDALAEETRQRLLAEVAEHEGIAGMHFGPEGSLAYDRTLKHFSMRYVVASDPDDGDEMAGALAEERAEAYLKERGYGHTGLRSTVTDMDTMKINRKSRG